MTWKTTYQTWLDKEDLDPELKASLQNYKEEEAKEAFYQPLEFGTAGMRGIMGPGINRMNIYTVRQATKGLADDLIAQGFVKAAGGVVIAYDSRHRSRLFAEEAARVLGQEKIKVYLFKDLRPTPLLSFAVRHFEAAAGLMITASHNPPAYNGYKVYNSNGGQILDDEAAGLTQHVRAVENPLDVQVADLKKMEEDGLLHWVGSELDELYLDHLEAVICDRQLIEDHSQDVNIVFTPLHGTGQTIALDALDRAGFKNVHVVEAQIEGDGDFPTVESPNPEDPKAFELAREKGEELGADLLIATDPDADRMGLAVRHGETYAYLTGNQIAALMVDYLLGTYQDQGRLPADGIVLKSIVSSSLPFEIAEAYGLATENTLTGFKYIADRIEAYEASGRKTFLFGFEESYGYLIQPFARDKDAIQATLLAAEMATAAKVKGKTLVDILEDLYSRYGYFEEKTISLSFEGIDGQERMQGILEDLRASSPSHWASIPVLASEDYLTGDRVHGGGQVEKLSLPSSNLLRYLLEDGSWIAIRPSGTEPKLKMYVGAKADTASLVKEKVKAFEEAVLALAQ